MKQQTGVNEIAALTKASFVDVERLMTQLALQDPALAGVEVISRSPDIDGALPIPCVIFMAAMGRPIRNAEPGQGERWLLNAFVFGNDRDDCMELAEKVYGFVHSTPGKAISGVGWVSNTDTFTLFRQTNSQLMGGTHVYQVEATFEITARPPRI